MRRDGSTGLGSTGLGSKGLGTGATLGLVAIGGALGVLVRFGLDHVLGDRMTAGGAIAAANVTGSFALGFLVSRVRTATVVRSKAHSDALLALVGTGLLGGYTTYSGMAVETVTSAQDSGLMFAALFLLLTVAGGMLACIVGLQLGARRRHS